MKQKIFIISLSLVLFFSASRIAFAVVNTYTAGNSGITCSDGTTNCGVSYTVSAYMETGSTGGTVMSPLSVSLPSSAGYNVLVGSNGWSVSCSSSASACSGTIFGHSFSAAKGQDLSGVNAVTSAVGGSAGSITATAGMGSVSGSYMYTMCSQSANGKSYSPTSDGYCTATAVCSSTISNSAAGQVVWSVTNGGNITIKNSSGATVGTGAGATSSGTISNLPPSAYTLLATGCTNKTATVLAPVLSASAPGGTTATVTTGSNSMNIIYTNTGPAKTTAHVNGSSCALTYSGAGITGAVMSPQCQTVDLPN